LEYKLLRVGTQWNWIGIALFGIGIDLELTKWNWVELELELTKWNWPHVWFWLC
jgi:hypothetical protein